MKLAKTKIAVWLTNDEISMLLAGLRNYEINMQNTNGLNEVATILKEINQLRKRLVRARNEG